MIISQTVQELSRSQTHPQTDITENNTTFAILLLCRWR